MKTHLMQLALSLLLTAPVLLAQASSRPGASKPAEYTYKVVHVFPHDPQAFTQGLVYHNGFLYEGTGLNGQSSLRKVALDTGKVVQHVELAPEYFGEGITIYKNEVIQITWQTQTAFVYSLDDFHLLRKFSYPGEGWGLATLGNEILLSDGSSEIRVLDPATFKEKRRIKVRDGDKAIDQLNELEVVNGEIFANIWHADRIARISPRTGRVTGWINLKGILSPIYKAGPDAVLNGIAYDAAHKRLFVTGKLWPSIFEIRVVPR